MSTLWRTLLAAWLGSTLPADAPPDLAALDMPRESAQEPGRNPVPDLFTLWLPDGLSAPTQDGRGGAPDPRNGAPPGRDRHQRS